MLNFFISCLFPKQNDVAANPLPLPLPDNVRQTKYDVFVSFRGEDIRGGFYSHLIAAFHRKNIKSFVDDNDTLERGNEIWPSLVAAIEGSFVSLIIFSENYASSRWCLDELVHIMQCKMKYQRIVIPIFYGTDPTDVRHQTGSYKNALAQNGNKYSSTKVQMWIDVLKNSANLAGITSSNFRNDAELIDEIVNLVLTRLSKHPTNSKGLVGIEKAIAHIESLLRQESKDTRVVGIWGMGGIGKTTIAEEIFYKVRSEYEGGCFLANVREESARHGTIFLKEKLFSTLLVEEVQIGTVNGLPHYVKTRIGRMKVLIALDDVNDLDQLETLVGDHDLFGKGSRIIITTRDRQVLAKYVDDIYEVRALDFGEALELFNLNAFKQNHIKMEYYELLSKKVVKYAKGIPLVVNVLGNLLHGKSMQVWESELNKLEKMPPKKVYDMMKLSYDDLDRKERKIFLDLACFFHGLNSKKDYINSLLKDGDNDNSVVVGLERLKDRALITFSENNIVSMHDIVQEMAWEIVLNESGDDLGRRSRLWDPNDVYDVLKNDKGTDAIKSMRMPLLAVRKLKLKPDIFANMSKLQLLHVPSEYDQDGMDLLPQGLQYLPDELRYLCWMHYPLKSLPETFSVERLVILDLSYSKVEKLWHGVQNLVNLKEVKLFFSRLLKELPDFSKAVNLQVLDIHFCSQLVSVHPSTLSIEKLHKLDPTTQCNSLYLGSLIHLNLRFCKNITDLLVISKNMIELDLRSTRINALPTSFGCQSKLEILHLAYCDIESLPSCFNNLTRLRYLDMRYCLKLKTLPELPPSLEIILAQECSSLNQIFFPLSTNEQFKENRKQVLFLNCLKLDENSLMHIELNAKINMMKFACKNLSTVSENKFCAKNDDHYDSFQAVYMYPGTSVPKWLVNKTTQDSIAIDLSAPTSPILGFIFCVILGEFPSYGDVLKFNIIVKDHEHAGKKDSVSMYMSKPSSRTESQHICVMYDQRCSQYLVSRVKKMAWIKIEAKTEVSYSHDYYPPYCRVEIEGFGIYPICTTTYHNFIQKM